MKLLDFIFIKERILKNKYKKVKIAGYIDCYYHEGVVTTSFTGKNTNLSTKGSELKGIEFGEVTAKGTLVIFNVNTGKEEKTEEYYFIWDNQKEEE